MILLFAVYVQQPCLVKQGYCKGEKEIGYCENYIPTEDEVAVVEPSNEVQKTFFSVMKKFPGMQTASPSLKIQPTKNPSKH